MFRIESWVWHRLLEKFSESVPGTAINVFGVVSPMISGYKDIAKGATETL